MVTYQEALIIAASYLKQRIKSSYELAVMEEETIEKPYGWIFFYQTKLYLETKQSKYAAYGTNPFIVEKSGGIAYLRGRANVDFPFYGDYNSLMDLQIAYEDKVREQEAGPKEDEEQEGFGGKSAADLIREIGFVEGLPSDLSTNPQHMEGFGETKNCRKL